MIADMCLYSGFKNKPISISELVPGFMIVFRLTYVLLFESRADATGTSSELGVLIPTTVIQKIITDVEKVYGQLYSRVLKTNLQGGVKYPIGS